MEGQDHDRIETPRSSFCDLLAVVRGDATDPSSVRGAMAGQDAVVAAVGGSGIAHALIGKMPGVCGARA
ncbi:NAD(P)H-binding protein [Nonomuraea sp. B1E8]|uniref:NAD(P)H-binding protein n=1 Tax=unclassified Nonomuraea TaxID=2593643 RepID=UPI00325F9210